MKTAVQLLQNYLDSIRDPKAAAALFAAEGALELPYLQTLGQQHRVQGPAAIESFIGGLLSKVPEFRFRNIRFLSKLRPRLSLNIAWKLLSKEPDGYTNRPMPGGWWRKTER